MEISEKEKQKSAKRYAAWQKEISAALEREKKFREAGKRLVELVEGDKVDEEPYNILYSNTETLAPAVYSATPRPQVKPRFHGEQPIAAAGAKVLQRVLEFLIDTGDPSYPTFDQLIESAVFEGLVPGRGLTLLKYDAELADVEDVSSAEEATEAELRQDVRKDAKESRVIYETVCGECIPWDRFTHGYAKKWRDVPWIGFWYSMTKDELIDHFGYEIGSRVEVRPSSGEAGDSGKQDEKDDTKTAKVWQIWDKTSRKVFYLSDGYTEGLLKEVDDPLELQGFFPVPEPLSFVTKISTLTPVALYKLYENQAKELNAVTRRISAIVRALKVRGMYDSTVEGIDKVLSAEDNTLIPADNVAALLNGMSLEKAVWLMPIDKLVAVLQQLLMHRQQIKSVIFEIMGIADIMRGSTQASETLGAQQLKNQWGSLRLKKPQRAVQNYVRACLRIMAEIAVTKLSIETLSGMTGLSFPRRQEKEQAQMVVRQAQMTGAVQSPEAAQQLAPFQEVLSKPSWEEITEFLRHDVLRNYQIDIETNSTVDAVVTEDKQDLGEFMAAMSQFMNGITPMVEAQVLPFEAAKAMLLMVVKQFNFGREAEEHIKQMQQPQPQSDPAQEAAQAEAQARQQELQAKAQFAQQKAQMEMEKLKMELEVERERLGMERERLQMEAQKARMELQVSLEELQLKAAASRQKFEAARAQAALRKKQPSGGR